MRNSPRARSRPSHDPRHNNVGHGGVLRVAPVMAIPAMLHAAGIDARAVLAEFGLSPADFEDPENVISFATLGAVLSRCVERSNCEHFGLRVGQRSGVSQLGTVGYLMQSAPDVRTALKELTEYLHIHDDGAVITLAVADAHATLSYTLLADGIESSEQILDAAIAIGHNILRGLCGPEWRATSVEFAHARPRSLEHFRKCFGVTPAFDAEQSALTFPAHWLDHALPSADPMLHRLMLERAGELRAMTSDDLAGRLRRVVRPLVSAPDCSLAVVARHLGMHARTLNRRLARQGTSFRTLREQIRLEAACQLLRNTRKPAYQVADILGYSDASAFTRAFRRWSGMAPARWRARHGRPLVDG